MRDRSLKLIRVSSMLFMAVVCAAAAFAQTATTYGGEATALSGTVAGVPVNLAATGAVDPMGGARNNSLVCYPGGPQCYVGVPDATSGLLSVQVLNAATVAGGNRTYSHAAVAKLAMTVNGVPITADHIEGTAKSTCPDDPPGERPSVSVGRSEFSRLVIGGVAVAVTGLPNQTLTVASPLGGTIKVVMNGQSVSNGYLIVSALQVTAPAILGVVSATNVTVGMAKTKIDCADVDKCLAAKITGGGFVIQPTTGAKITFAASGQNLSDWGHVVVVNHSTGEKLKATVQETTIIDGDATILGEGLINGTTPVTFRARLKDVDEPGRGADMFGFTVLTPPDLVDFLVPDGTKLAGGNIQFHKPKGDCPPPVDCVMDPTAPGCPPPDPICRTGEFLDPTTRTCEPCPEEPEVGHPCFVTPPAERLPGNSAAALPRLETPTTFWPALEVVLSGGPYTRVQALRVKEIRDGVARRHGVPRNGIDHWVDPNLSLEARLQLERDRFERAVRIIVLNQANGVSQQEITHPQRVPLHHVHQLVEVHAL